MAINKLPTTTVVISFLNCLSRKSSSVSISEKVKARAKVGGMARLLEFAKLFAINDAGRIERLKQVWLNAANIGEVHQNRWLRLQPKFRYGGMASLGSS